MSLIHRSFPALESFTPTWKLFDEAFDHFFNEPSSLRPWSPAVDISETENELVLTADLPGLKKNEIQVKLENGTLTLSGERKFEKEDKSSGYHRIERSYGSFKRCFQLPDTVDANKVDATYQDGVLRVTLAKKEVAKPRTIDVAVKS
jgi:HSP20 family protein